MVRSGLPEQSHEGGEGAHCGNPGAEPVEPGGGIGVSGEQQERPWGKQEGSEGSSKGQGNRRP